MVLNFSNLSVYTPTALSLVIKGTNTVTKALAAVTISGNTLTYSPSSAEKTSLGTGILTVQVKITTAGGMYSSEIIRLDANDLDNEVITILTLSTDGLSTITGYQAGTNVTINRLSGYSFMGLNWISLSITTSASITSSAALVTGLPNAEALTDFPMTSTASGIMANVRTNGTIHFGATTAAGNYVANFIYR